ASGAVRPRAQAPAVRADGHDLLTAVDAFADALRALPVPTLLLTATAGMFGDPPGFIPEHLVATWQAHAPALRAELVPDTNHYTIILTPTAAAAVAERITDPNTWPAP
ncbi:MAG TPA: hypothetical protein VFQ76_11140, partial [Longimicrobiaceae bacterium]|nr:hypothetical protein [Longimicrobiaceae bacterium]